MRKVIILSMFALVMLFAASISASAQSSVAGEWDAAMNTPGGPVPVKLVFVVDGEKLSGTAKRSRGDVPLSGTIKGKDIEFSYTVSYNGNDVTISFAGTVSGDTMGGMVSFSGQAEDGWSAKRTPPPAPKP